MVENNPAAPASSRSNHRGGSNSIERFMQQIGKAPPLLRYAPRISGGFPPSVCLKPRRTAYRKSPSHLEEGSYCSRGELKSQLSPVATAQFYRDLIAIVSSFPRCCVITEISCLQIYLLLNQRFPKSAIKHFLLSSLKTHPDLAHWFFRCCSVAASCS